MRIINFFRKKRILLVLLVLFIFLASYVIFDYVRWELVKSAIAVSGVPAQDGGKINLVRFCVIDSPPSSPVECAISCPLATGVLHTACAGYNELDVTSQLGTPFLAVPKGFVYKGGGTFPEPGMDYIYGGASNVTPWDIGIPGLAKRNTDKIVDWLKYIIAGKRDN